jgi:metal-dependent amidase/aminoacylase/carboxypeptidase family protein
MTDPERRATQLASALPAAESVEAADAIGPTVGPLDRWTVSVVTCHAGLGPGAIAVVAEYHGTVRSIARQGRLREAVVTV